MTGAYDPAADPVHGSGWNSAARCGGWSWSAPRDGEWFRTCSFCGCIHPEDLAPELWGSGAHLSWADFKYGWPHKVYVNDLKSREPERLHVISAKHEPVEGPYVPGGEKYQPMSELMPGLTWVRPSEIPEGAVTDGWGDLAEKYDWVGLGARETLFAKFYTVHLKDLSVSQDVKDAIQRASGLRLTWLDDGRVQWEPWAA